MSMIHSAGAQARATILRHEVHAGERAAHTELADDPDHDACVAAIRELREENELLRRSANEFAALAERLQRALVRERGRTTRQNATGPADRAADGNYILTISLQIEAEFSAIPNLRLTRWQAARLWDLEQAECDEALASLVRSRVLRE